MCVRQRNLGSWAKKSKESIIKTLRSYMHRFQLCNTALNTMNANRHSQSLSNWRIIIRTTNQAVAAVIAAAVEVTAQAAITSHLNVTLAMIK
jgi:hypothetical protein